MEKSTFVPDDSNESAKGGDIVQPQQHIDLLEEEQIDLTPQKPIALNFPPTDPSDIPLDSLKILLLEIQKLPMTFQML